jgi:hypothetical protein
MVIEPFMMLSRAVIGIIIVIVNPHRIRAIGPPNK